MPTCSVGSVGAWEQLRRERSIGAYAGRANQVGIELGRCSALQCTKWSDAPTSRANRRSR